eukprot:gene12281-2924_t
MFSYQSFTSAWSYNCKNDVCLKTNATPNRRTQLNTCLITCGRYGGLWPHPSGKTFIGNMTLPIQLWNIAEPKITFAAPQNKKAEQLATAAYQIFKARLNKIYRKFNVKSLAKDGAQCNSPVWEYKFSVKINIKAADAKLHLDTDESYSLVIRTVNSQITAEIDAETFFGARHGLETLGQLITFDDICGSMQVVTDVDIEDAPAYPLRGFMLDTSRNFFSVDSILKIIDGMALNKLNTFHWHITDTHSFPIYIKEQPEMTQYGAYSQRHIYMPDDVKKIVQYAAARGIRVMPEFDQPAHCGNGWQWGPKKGFGRMATCVNKDPWTSYCVEPPCGQLNPLNDHMYNVLGTIYKSYLEMFDLDIFHIGGDEVNIGCWNSTEEITKHMEDQGKARTEKDFMDLWKVFLDRTTAKFREANKNQDMPLILWSSHMTYPKYIEKYVDKSKYIIQIWSEKSDKTISNLINKGYRVVFSNYDAVYLDCGFGGWVTDGNNWCAPYKEWQRLYNNDPKKILADFGIKDPAKLKLVLGGESAMWSEQVDESALGTKVWPRAAAYAERLWSDPNTNWRAAEARLLRHRERMVHHGIAESTHFTISSWHCGRKRWFAYNLKSRADACGGAA